MKIREIFEAVAKEPGKLGKEAILKQNSSALLSQILTDTYGLDKYNIKKYDVIEDAAQPAVLTIDDSYHVFHELLGSLTNRTITGNEARESVGRVIGWFVPEDRVWLDRILQKNLKIGAGETFSKDSGVTKKFPVALADKLEDCKGIDLYDGTWKLSRKLDGCRCLAFVGVNEDGVDVKFISRQEKEFTTLDNLKPAYQKFFEGMTGEWIVDGEVCLIDENGKESFAGMMSEIRRKNHTIANPVHLVFDVLTADEFWNGKGRTFEERYKYMIELFGSWEGRNIRLLDQYDCTPTRMNEMMAEVEAQGWEGLMARKANVQYEGKRTKNMVKIKPMKDDEYIVIGVINGKLTYNTTEGSQEIEAVSALTIEHKGNIVKVGSGMTKEQRQEWFEDPSKIIGKTITVQYFSESLDKKTGEFSLRFPVLKYVYENGRDC